MKKLLITIAAAVALAAAAGTTALADDSINVIVNGEAIDFSGDQAPIIQNDRTLVPFRAVFEKMGAKVDWYEDSQLCEATYGSITVNLTIGENVMYIGDAATVEVDVPAQIINDRTMVPVRVISEGIGATVNWDEETRTVTVDTPELTEGFPSEVSYVTESASVSNEKNGMTIAFDYPVVTDKYTAADKLNKAVYEDIKKAAQQTVDNYAGDLTEANISYYVKNEDNGIFEVNYIINGTEVVYTATYAIASGSKMDDDYLTKEIYGDTRLYRMRAYRTDKQDENGNTVSAYVEYPSFIGDGEIVSDINTRFEDSAKKAADEFVENNIKNADGETSFISHCHADVGEGGIATVTTEYTEVINGEENKSADIVTVDLTTGEISE